MREWTPPRRSPTLEIFRSPMIPGHFALLKSDDVLCKLADCDQGQARAGQMPKCFVMCTSLRLAAKACGPNLRCINRSAA